MKKWIKLLADYDGQKAGALIEVDEPIGKALITGKVAETSPVRRAPSGMSEAVDPDGGLLIPPDFSTTIWDRARATNDLLGRCQQLAIAGNIYTMNADAETSQADGSRHGGTQGYWEG